MTAKKEKNLYTLVLTSVAAIGFVTPLAVNANPSIGIDNNNYLIAQQPNCKEPQTQSEMNYCAKLDYVNADKKLNQVYKSLTPKLSEGDRNLLVNAQRAWVPFRDGESDFWGRRAEGGSMQSMLVSERARLVTEQRTADLNSYQSKKILPSGERNYRQVDRKLNDNYTLLRNVLSDQNPNTWKKLQKTQQAWISFRDANCKFEASLGGSSAGNTCLIRMTEYRNNQLQQHVEIYTASP